MVNNRIFQFFCFIVLAATQAVAESQLDGTWNEMNNDPNGVSATIVVKTVGRNKLQMQFNGNNAALGFSNDLESIAGIKDNTAVFKPDVDPEHACIITFKFVDGTLMVSQESSCGLGKGISVEGTYYKQVLEN